MRSGALIAMPDPEWVTLLRSEVAKRGSIAAVAADIGMARPSLSMLLAGKYPAGLDKVTRKFEARVFARYRDQVFCPHQRAGIAAQACRALATAPMSTSHPEKLRQWRACQGCPQNPVKHHG